MKGKFTQEKKFSWYGRLGGGIGGRLLAVLERENKAGWGGLGAITMLTGKKNNHFELNSGAFIAVDEYGDKFIFPIFNTGYRFQKPEGGFVFQGKCRNLFFWNKFWVCILNH